mmetsp:Transcript_40498/g.94738  ORF Transcript_40498/g.94738 Transcript_40498/m.94738 type:complete len:104 (+) Transcript_40498:19-330(+)
MERMEAEIGQGISPQIWAKHLQECKVSKQDMNSLIMHFLLVEGYKSAAESFAQETGTPLSPVHTGFIEERMAIRNALRKGEIVRAIELLNDLDPLVVYPPCLH